MPTLPKNPTLAPALDGRNLTVDQALKHPTATRDRIVKIADDLLVATAFYTPAGGPVQGGGLLYTTTRAADQYLDGTLEERAPGGEYKQLQGVDPDAKLAPVRDWGAKFRIEDERRIRNDVDYLDQQTTQLTNTIAAKIDDEALRVLDAALDDVIAEQPTITGHSWGDAIITGPLDQLTPSGELPTADWSKAQLTADLQQLGVHHDVLVVHPSSAHALRVLYADKLANVLESAGLQLISNNKVAINIAYVAAKGQAGIIAFETPLTVTSWPDPETRTTVVQAFVVPAFAVTKPFHVKRILGIV